MRKILFFLSISVSVLFVACDKQEPDDNNDDDTNTTLADFTTNWQKAWGTQDADDFSGAVVDNSGNLYFVGASEPDGYAADVFLTKFNLSNQTVEWSKSYDLGDRDYQPSPSENGHSQGGGGSRCIAIDAAGNVYIAGTTKQGFNEVFVAKVSSSGTILWQTFWEADNSGLAKGSAKAYALDVKNDRVFVTGSTGAGSQNEEAMIFLLVLDAASGDVNPLTLLGINPSDGYNDRGYVVKATQDDNVYVAGWEGKDNSGFLMRFSCQDSTLQWFERIDIGYAARFTDIDFDESGNIYLAADIRGVSTYLGVVKTDASGNVIWSKQFQGESNDRNNVSSVRIINSNLYVGGRGAFTNYDVSQYGDGCFIKMDLDGNVLKKYNYFTGSVSGERSGERVEAILSYNGNLIIAGEAWPESSKIDGKWYIPTLNVYDLSTSVTVPSLPEIVFEEGVVVDRTFSESTISQQAYNPEDGSKGSADVLISSIKE